MNRKLEAILTHLMHRFSCLLHRMTTLVSIEHVVIHRLQTHLQTSHSSTTPHLAVFISHILWSCFNRESDDTMSACLIDLHRLFYRLRECNIKVCNIIVSATDIMLFIRCKKLIKRIARVIESLQEITLVVIWIDIPRTTEHDHFDLIGIVTC